MTYFYIIISSLFVVGIIIIVLYIRSARNKAKQLVSKTQTNINQTKHDYFQLEKCQDAIFRKFKRIGYKSQRKNFISLLKQIKIVLSFRDSNILLKQYVKNKDYRGNSLIDEISKYAVVPWSEPERIEYLELSQKFKVQEQTIINEFIADLLKYLDYLNNHIQYVQLDVNTIDLIESFCKHYTNEERFKQYRQLLILLNNKATNVKNEIERHEMQIKLEYKRREIQEEINSYVELIRDKNIDAANTKEKKIEKMVSTIDCPDQKCIFEEIKFDYCNQKKQGISVFKEECYANYDINTVCSQNQYVLLRYPSRGTIIWPHRRGIIARRGYTEKSFESLLKSYIQGQIDIFGDVNLLPQSGYRPYEPDIAVIDVTSGHNIRIDIEIDEPYEAITRKPTHYIGCGDEYRDTNLNNLGWIVVRFSERQIHNQSVNCVAYIARLINSINSKFVIPAAIVSITDPNPENQWTQLEAQKMAGNSIREEYLKHNFGKTENIAYKPEEINLNDFEKQIRNKVKPTIILNSFHKRIQGIDNDFSSDNHFSYNIENAFPQDREIQFILNRHIYICNGIIFKAVSNLISELFPVFDSFRWATRKAVDRNIPTKQILEEWECKGAKSREVGTYLHQQIENYFLGKKIEDNYHFAYNGEFIKCNEDISIKTEYQYFKNFLQNNLISPFRTEWRICDKSNQIAGTIDCICKDGNKYNIYDWKRSSKLYDNNPYENGLGKLNHLENISLNHYYLQQNLYKYILEHNYGLLVDKMYLIYLHNDYDGYKKVTVPDMPEEIQYIFQWMND